MKLLPKESGEEKEMEKENLLLSPIVEVVDMLCDLVVVGEREPLRDDLKQPVGERDFSVLLRDDLLKSPLPLLLLPLLLASKENSFLPLSGEALLKLSIDLSELCEARLTKLSDFPLLREDLLTCSPLPLLPSEGEDAHLSFVASDVSVLLSTAASLAKFDSPVSQETILLIPFSSPSYISTVISGGLTKLTPWDITFLRGRSPILATRPAFDLRLARGKLFIKPSFSLVSKT